MINERPYQAVFVFIFALIAMLLFAAGTMYYFMVKLKLWESAVLSFAAFVVFQPGYFINLFSPKSEQRPAAELFAVAE